MHCFVYVLRCHGGSFFTGVAEDVEVEVEEINSGRGNAYTRSRLPAFLFYKEEYMNRRDAERRAEVVRAMTRTEKERLAAVAPPSVRNHRDTAPPARPAAWYT